MVFLRGKGRGTGGAVSRVLRLAALSIVVGGLAGAQRPERSPDPTEHRLARAFEGPRTHAELRRRLAAAGARDIPQLFELAVEGRFLDGPESEPLDESERTIVREVLAARPRRELVPFLEDLAGRPLPASARREALALLGSAGSGDHLKLLARLCVPPQERAVLAPDVRASFTDALGAILLRDHAALIQVPALFSESQAVLSGSIVGGLARVPTAEATRVLAMLLGRSPGLDPLLLARLGERGERRSGRDEFVLGAVRRYLRQRDPLLVSAAAQACGALGDEGAVSEIVGLMDHADARVRASAFGALERISGLAFGPEAARWTSWYHAEMRWWDEEADALLVCIERGRGVEFARAAREVLEHRLFRDRMAESFARALRRSNVREVGLACRALEQLRSPVAIVELVECLERDEPVVREAAWKALRAITGVELPPEADSWSKLAG